METLDVLVSLARSLRGRGPLRLRKEDFVGAFKTLPLALAALCMAVAVWGEAAQEGWALQLWCCPFGAVASVYAWERFGSAIQVCVRMRGDGVGRSVRAASAAGDPGSAFLRSDGEVRRRPIQCRPGRRSCERRPGGCHRCLPSDPPRHRDAFGLGPRC